MMDDFNLYTNKKSHYFGSARTDIEWLLPPLCPQSILEIGCGNGSTLLWLKQRYGVKCSSYAGIELMSNCAKDAREKGLCVFQGNFEEMCVPMEPASIDLILCLDLLEHLTDPWLAVNKLAALLKPGGTLIASIPNVRHHRVILPLLFKGRWDYGDTGILDKTHLRFFTRRNAIELILGSGLRVEKVLPTGFEPGAKSIWANAITFGLFRVMFERQYLIKATKDI